MEMRSSHVTSTGCFLSPIQSVRLVSYVQDCFRNRNESRKTPQTCFVSEKCQKAEKTLLVGRSVKRPPKLGRYFSRTAEQGTPGPGF